MDEQHIPIDIHITKLIDWLISRRHINKEWQKNILTLREKINHAIQDMPEHKDIVNLLSGQHINYFNSLKIIEILKETEADTKNIFGGYSSQRMNDWKNIVADYRKDNIYLAEASQMLIRNVNYEIPSLKKQVLKLEQQQAECEKKIKDYVKLESMSLREFESSCEKLGIPGKSIKSELLGLLDDLPKLYEGVADKIKIVQPAIDLYTEFVKFQSNDCDIPTLPTLKYLINNGNTTTYEFAYGEKPIKVEMIERQRSSSSEEEKSLDTGDIDFCDNGGAIDFGDGIDFGVGDNNAQGEIDWGAVNTEESFEIVTHDDLTLEESGIFVEKSGAEGGIARGEEALTILDNPKTHDQIINDLLELEVFLKIRLSEMSGIDNDVLAMSQMLDAPSILQMQTIETITTYSDCVNIALNELTNQKIQHLHNIKHSPKYVDILTTNLKQKLYVVDRMKAQEAALENKIVKLRNEGRDLNPVIGNLISKSKELQKEIQEDISKKYKGRVVNIVGGINLL